MKDTLEDFKKGITRGMFGYEKKNGRTIAPCGIPHRCKRHH